MGGSGGIISSGYIGCVMVLPEGSSSTSFSSEYLQKCGRKTPHMYGNLELKGIPASDLTAGDDDDNIAALTALRAGLASAAGVVVDDVSIDLIQDSSRASDEAGRRLRTADLAHQRLVELKRSDDATGAREAAAVDQRRQAAASSSPSESSQAASSLVWFIIDYDTAAEAEESAHLLEKAAYGDGLLTSIKETGVLQAAATVELREVGVKVPDHCDQRQCVAGQYVPEGGSACTICEPGYFCRGGDYFKERCANGDIQAGGARSRSDCACLDGFGGANGICMDCTRLACAAGNFSVGCGGASAGSCQACPACDGGSFRDGCTRNAEGTCVSCPDGTYVLGREFRNSAASCLACGSVCPAGQYAVGCGGGSQGECQACDTASCPSGQYLAGCGGTSPGQCEACTLCPAGQYTAGCQGQAAGNCVPCEELTYADETGIRLGGCEARCVTCPVGEGLADCTASTGPGRCMPCPRGQFKAEGGSGGDDGDTRTGGTCRSCCPAYGYQDPDVGCTDMFPSLTQSLRLEGVEAFYHMGRTSPYLSSSLDLWSYTTGGDVYSSPAVSGDGATVYVGSYDSKLYALDAATGTVKWSYTTGGEVRSSPAVSGDGATVYVGSIDNKLYALDAATGTVKWSYTTGGEVRSSPAVSGDGATVCVGSDDSKLYALDAATGTVKWSYTTGGDVYSSPAVSGDGATVYVGSIDNKLYALDAATGTVKWSYTTGGEVRSSPAVSGDGATVYVGSRDTKLYALDAATGTVKWSYTTGGDVWSSPAVSGDGATVYVGSYDNKLYALNSVLQIEIKATFYRYDIVTTTNVSTMKWFSREWICKPSQPSTSLVSSHSSVSSPTAWIESCGGQDQALERANEMTGCREEATPVPDDTSDLHETCTYAEKLTSCYPQCMCDDAEFAKEFEASIEGLLRELCDASKSKYSLTCGPKPLLNAAAGLHSTVSTWVLAALVTVVTVTQCTHVSLHMLKTCQNVLF